MTHKQIIKKYQSGMSGRAIAELCGCSYQNIYNILDQHGIDRLYRGKAKQFDHKLIRRLARKMTRREVADEVGCSVSLVRNIVIGENKG